jgi:hypothetical protein
MTLGILAFFGTGVSLGQALLRIIIPQTAYTTVIGGFLLSGTRLRRVLEISL